jgi:hypothetical protein
MPEFKVDALRQNLPESQTAPMGASGGQIAALRGRVGRCVENCD